ncbi:MAG: Cysteine desulfurase [Parcubacteria group bacterium GW2011_GWC2_42_6]|nr:MAG: Cysteine desulfurase [Parcubacteria group bacterium GW2011_GWC2_42_6]
MEKNKTKIYLDNGATTPVDPEVFEAMRPYFSEIYGNPSSVHQFGVAAQEAVVKARQQVAKFLHCEAKEVIFTSGATEGNNTVIKSIGENQSLAQIEHDCVLASTEKLVKNGRVEATFLPVNRDGRIELAELEKNIKPNTVLISIMYANNETGSVQPIAEIGKLLKKLNADREHKIYFHTDAAQAINYLDCDVQRRGFP